MNGSTPGTTIHVVGDSHVSVFAGQAGLIERWPREVAGALPGVRCCHLGPYLAHSVATARHPVRRLVRSALRSARPQQPVLLVFGEIDCRAHIIPHAAKSRRTVRRMASTVAEAYARAGRALVGRRAMGLWAAPPPVSGSTLNEEHPTRGTFAQRLGAVRAFNRALEREAANLGADFLSVFDEVADSGGRLRSRFTADGVHLGRAALPLVVEAMIRAGWVDRPDRLRGGAWALARLEEAPSAIDDHAVAAFQRRALIDRVALECVALGARRIAIYGAGRHTRDVGFEPYRRRGLRVVAVLDDTVAERALLGVPIRRPTAAGADFDAVVVSSDAREREILRRARVIFGPGGVPVLPIYDWPARGRVSGAPRGNASERRTRSTIRKAIRS